jgi:hypothetical protein
MLRPAAMPRRSARRLPLEAERVTSEEIRVEMLDLVAHWNGLPIYSGPDDSAVLLAR